MLKLLLKKQIIEIFRSYFYNQKKNSSRSKAGTIAYILLFAFIMVGVLGGMFTGLSLSLCAPLSDAGMDWLYFAIMGLLALFMGVFGSVFNTYSCLYLSKDNDLMLSLPIPANMIIISRMLTVYLLGIMYSSVVIVPAVIVYWMLVSASLSVILGSLLLVILISVFNLVLSCALGWVVAKISLRLKNKSFVTVGISLAFLGGYYFFYYKAQALIQDIVANAADYGTKIKGSAYPLYLFGSVGVGDIVAVLIVSAVVFALFAVVWTLISRSFLKIATSSGKTAKRIYKEKTVKQKSISSSLLAKEFRRFLSSPIYMLNCGLGILLLPISGIFFLWRGSAVVSMMNEIYGSEDGVTPLMLCAVVCVLASLNDMATPSVSLEGKSIWLLQSLPVKPWQVLRAKLSLQLILTGIPVIFCIVCLAFVYPFSIPQFILSAVVLLSYVLFSALFALFLGLKMPNLNWTSEVTPLKQNFSVLIAMLSGFGYTILFCTGYLSGGLRLGFTGYMAVVGIITLVLCAVLLLWFVKKGCSLFASL